MTGALAMSAAIPLVGCGIRLESDAPDLPGLKTQGPPPDAGTLSDALASLQQVLVTADDVAASADPWIGPIRTAHRAQITRLIDVMAAAGITPRSAAGSASPSPTPTGTPEATPTPSSDGAHRATSSTTSSTSIAAVQALIRAENTFRPGATARRAWSASASNRPTLVAICVVRHAAQHLLASDPKMPRGVAPATVSSLPIARAIRPAVHGFELMAGKTPQSERAQVGSTLEWLTGARDQLGAVVGEPEKANYPLPVRVTDADSRRRLAQALLTNVLQAVASQTDRVAAQGSGAQDWTFRLWSLAAADHARWGAPVAAFPGLKT